MTTDSTTTKPGAPKWVVERLIKGHDKRSFSCGVDALDRYLRRQASQDARRSFATVFVGVDAESTDVWGYYTLAMAGVALDLIPDDLRRKMPRYPTVPAVRLGRLAVATSVKGQGRGTFLLVDALRRALRTEVAWAAFVVDAKDEGAQRFYEQFGFDSFQDDPLHLFLARGTVEKLFQ